MYAAMQADKQASKQANMFKKSMFSEKLHWTAGLKVGYTSILSYIASHIIISCNNPFLQIYGPSNEWGGLGSLSLSHAYVLLSSVAGFSRT